MANEVYLSYARTNATLARAVYRFIRSAGLRVWFDEAAPGDGTWLARGHRAIRHARHHVILLTDTTPMAWQRAELDFAARSAALNAELQTTPLVRDGYEPGEMEAWLDDNDAHRLPSDKSLLDTHLKELVARLSDPDGVPRPPPAGATINPYPGLLPYGINDARDFFGRDAELAEALSRLGTQPDGGHRRWLRVEGPPGIGKASFARGGLVPAVVRGGIAGAPTDWRVAACRPAERAGQSLSLAVAAAFSGLVSTEEVMEQLASKTGLTDLVHEHLPADQGLVLVVDHLDDVLTEGLQHPEEMARFDALLSEALDDFDHRLFLFTTGRNDVTQAVLALLPGLAAAAQLHSAVYELGGLSLAGIQDVLNGPAQMAGRPWAEDLAAQVATDALQSPQLPGRLSWILNALWHGKRADTQKYADLAGLIDGPAVALDRQFEALGDDERTRTRSLLTALVGAGRGHGDMSIALENAEAVTAAGGGPRASQLLDTLESSGGDGELVTPLVKTARDGGVDYVRLAHGTLPQMWPRLRGWLDADRAVLERRHDVEAATASWGGDDADLPSGARLLYYAGHDLPDEQTQRLRSSMRTQARHYVEAAERHEKEAAESANAAARETRATEARAREAERALATGRIRRLRLLVLLLMAVVGVCGVLWLQSTETAGDLRTHMNAARRSETKAKEALRTAEERHIAAEQSRKNAENERRVTERERRVSDHVGAQAEESADEMLRLVVEATLDADRYIARISHSDADYARRAYLQSQVRRAAKLLEKTPDNRRMHILLGRLHTTYADSIISMGSKSAAGAAYAEAVKAFAKLAEGDTADVRDLQALAQAYGRLGRYHAERRREETAKNPSQALEAFAKAGAIWKRLEGLQPEEAAHRAGAAADITATGLVQQRAGRHDQALASHDRSVDMTRALLKGAPTDVALKHALAIRLGYAGDVVLEQGKRDAAVKRYTEALGLIEKLSGDEGLGRTRDRLRSRLKRAHAVP